jgi:plastocyanin
VLTWQGMTPPVEAQQRVVTIRDNNALSGPGVFDPAQSRWAYSPDSLVVTRGEIVRFQNPPGSNHEHTVTSYVRAGGPAAPTLVVGTVFDSSPPPSATNRIPIGGEFVLDTGTLPPVSQNIAYFCRLHPWMNGEITVVVP